MKIKIKIINNTYVVLQIVEYHHYKYPKNSLKSTVLKPLKLFFFVHY